VRTRVRRTTRTTGPLCWAGSVRGVPCVLKLCFLSWVPRPFGRGGGKGGEAGAEEGANGTGGEEGEPPRRKGPNESDRKEI
jgi:hypothetical protein